MQKPQKSCYLPLRLNLGCGEKMYPKDEGWVNIDLTLPDTVNGHWFIKHDLRRTLPFASNTADNIYASHIIEHFTVKEWESIRIDWYRVLKPGGGLVIECPDAVKAAGLFASDFDNRRWQLWHTVLYGEAPEVDEETGMGDGRFGRHKQGFDIPRITAELKALGMTITRARPWNPEGTLVPFNIRVEAVKS